MPDKLGPTRSGTVLTSGLEEVLAAGHMWLVREVHWCTCRELQSLGGVRRCRCTC